MANRYYTSFPISVGECILQGPEARHLATVMRARPGDAVCLFDGSGCEYPAIITAVGKRDVTLQVSSIETPIRELPIQLEIAAAVPKGDREEFLLEKLTELGVTRFVPLITDRSVVVPKLDRLRRTVIEASKQCGRNVLMDVAEVTKLDSYLRGELNCDHRWIAHPQPAASVPNVAKGSFACVIGPEGGFTDNEVLAATASGWQCINLGPRILRIETAATALAAYCSFNAKSA